MKKLFSFTSLFLLGALTVAQAATTKRALNPQPLPPGMKAALNPQPLPPGSKVAVNPQPLPPGSALPAVQKGNSRK